MKVAVTGGIAEGKSTVLEIIRSAGFSAANADEFAREVRQRPETERKIQQILGVSGPVDPSELRNRLSGDIDIRRAINAAMHPEILRLMRASDAQFIEVPLLIECSLQTEFDQIWVVTCGFDEQLRRLTERLGDVVSARALIDSQLASRVKIPFADMTIRTNQDFESVKAIVLEALAKEFG